MRPGQAKLRVIAVPNSARVYVAGRFVGSARVLDAKPKKLSRGVHYLSIEAPGYFPHDLSVKLVPGTTTVRIKLRAVPP